MEKKGQKYDYVALLEPTSPLRAKDDIDKAIHQLRSCSLYADSLVSVGEVVLEKPWIQLKTNDAYIEWYTKNNGKAYFPYGVIYISKVSTLRKTKTFYQKKTIPYYIQRWQNYEVDDIFDFKAISAIMILEKQGGI